MIDADQIAWAAWAPLGCRTLVVDGPDGRAMDLMLSLPEGVAPDGGWPLLLALDGDRFFGALSGAADALSTRTSKTGVVPMAIAALAHRQDQGVLEDQRTRDFTRRICAESPSTRASQGGETLHRLIADEVLPLLFKAAPIDLARSCLFGHSLAGLFVLETLERDPALFTRWVSVSPSLWWSRPSPAIAHGSVFVGCGEAELARDMRDQIRTWVAEGQDRAIFRVADRSDHGSAPFALIPDILRHASSAVVDPDPVSGKAGQSPPMTSRLPPS